MLEDLDYDSVESPAIGLVPAGTSWPDVLDHIKISHAPLLMRPDGAEYAGVYWTGTDAVVVGDLGPDLDQAIDDFREFLVEHGQA